MDRIILRQLRKFAGLHLEHEIPQSLGGIAIGNFVKSYNREGVVTPHTSNS
jgi:hypothetical protein